MDETSGEVGPAREPLAVHGGGRPPTELLEQASAFAAAARSPHREAGRRLRGCRRPHVWNALPRGFRLHPLDPERALRPGLFREFAETRRPALPAGCAANEAG